MKMKGERNYTKWRMSERAKYLMTLPRHFIIHKITINAIDNQIFFFIREQRSKGILVDPFTFYIYSHFLVIPISDAYK